MRVLRAPRFRLGSAARCLFLVFSLSLLSACALNNLKVSNIADGLDSSMDVELALAEVEKIKPNANDIAQHQLNLGYLQLVTGHFDQAIANLQNAKGVMEKLQAASVTETLGSVTVNDKVKSYKGFPTDRVLVHGILALAYLQKQDLQGARVELLQADVMMNQLGEKHASVGQLASVRFMAGMVYEMNGEWDNALISYRKAYQTLTDRGESIPFALQVSLIKATEAVDLMNENKRFKEQFGAKATDQAKLGNREFVIYLDGVVSQMASNTVSLWWSINEVYLNVSLPTFLQENYYPRHVKVRTGSEQPATQTIENIESRVREDLNSRMPAITATALARTGAKYQMVQSAQKESQLAGIFANVLTLATEIADTRHWTFLPSTIQVARFDGESGEYQLDKNYVNFDVEADPSAYQVVLVSSLSTQIYSAQFNE